jgi:galactoside O-acetyltransferase
MRTSSQNIQVASDNPMNIETLLRKLFHLYKRTRKIDLKSVSMGQRTETLPGFGVDIRFGPKEGRIKIGNDSILSCNITLERDIGSVIIGDNTYIGASHIICAKQITIGSDVIISWGCTIVDHDSHSLIWSERAQDIKDWKAGFKNGIEGSATLKNWQSVQMSPIQIENKVWLGLNVTILKGITIGEGSVVGAGSVVTRDVPAWTLVAGNPAKIIKPLPCPDRENVI